MTDRERDFRKWLVTKLQADDRLRGRLPSGSHLYRQSYEDALKEYKADKKAGRWPKS